MDLYGDSYYDDLMVDDWIDYETDQSETQKAVEQGERLEEQPLYSGCDTTLGATLTLITLFAQKHHLSAEGITELLQLLQVLLPPDNILYKTYSQFRNYFSRFKYDYICHTYCKKCCSLVEDHGARVCSNAMCAADLTKQDSTEYFIEMPIEAQLASFFETEGFYESLQHRFDRVVPEGVIADVYDGKLYKRCTDLKDPNNISFILNTDGAPVFHR